jgi:hypothetical protein
MFGAGSLSNQPLLLGIGTPKDVLRSGTTRGHIARNITVLRFSIGIPSPFGSHCAIQPGTRACGNPDSAVLQRIRRFWAYRRRSGSYTGSTVRLLPRSRLLARKSSTDEMGVYRARKLFNYSLVCRSSSNDRNASLSLVPAGERERVRLQRQLGDVATVPDKEVGNTHLSNLLVVENA